MESRPTTTTDYRDRFDPFERFGGDDELTRQRLDTLLALNHEKTNEKAVRAAELEKVEASLMKNPLSSEQAFSYFGLLLGLFSPIAFFVRLFMERPVFKREDFWVFGVVAIVAMVTGIVGYFSGRSIGKVVRNLEKTSWLKMLVLLPLLGFFWGALVGGAGGAVILVFGAVIGGIFGAVAGTFALPAFAIFHRLLKKDDQIDHRHFLPLAFGITFAIYAFIIGV